LKVDLITKEEAVALVEAAVARAIEIGGERQFFNTAQAADFLGTTEDAIKAMVKRGQLTPVRRKPYRLFTRDELIRVATSEPDEWAGPEGSGQQIRFTPMTRQTGGHRANGPAPTTRRFP
jgi:hypothetical protein